MTHTRKDDLETRSLSEPRNQYKSRMATQVPEQMAITDTFQREQS